MPAKAGIGPGDYRWQGKRLAAGGPFRFANAA